MIVNYAGHREVVRFVDGDRVTTHVVRGKTSLQRARKLEDYPLPIGYIGHVRREREAGREPLTVEEWRSSIVGGR